MGRATTSLSVSKSMGLASHWELRIGYCLNSLSMLVLLARGVSLLAASGASRMLSRASLSLLSL